MLRRTLTWLGFMIVFVAGSTFTHETWAVSLTDKALQTIPPTPTAFPDWQQTTKLFPSSPGRQQFGHSIDIDEQRQQIIVGTPAESTKGLSAGAAYIFEVDNGDWIRKAKLVASDGETGDHFGNAVAIHDNIAVVGAYREGQRGDLAGAIYIFERVNDEWLQAAKRSGNDTEAGDAFGISVDIDEDRIAVGAFDAHLGAVYTFIRSNGSWTQETKLTEDAAGGHFGISVGISSNTLAVTAPKDDSVNIDAGAVYVFSLVNQQWHQTAKLLPDGYTNYEKRFILSSVDTDGANVIVGASSSGESAGLAYVYSNNQGMWERTAKLFGSDTFGKAVAVHGNLAAVSAYEESTYGTAYLFSGLQNNWIQEAYLSPVVAGQVITALRFGSSIAIEGRTIVVGSDRDSTLSTDSGAVFVFEDINNPATPTPTFTATPTATDTPTFTATPTTTPTSTPTNTTTRTPTVTPFPTHKAYAGEVFFDHNRNGIREVNEPGVEGITVLLQKLNGEAIEEEWQAVTDAGGYFLFFNVPSSNARVGFVPPPDYGTDEIQWVAVGSIPVVRSFPYAPIIPTATPTFTPTPTATPVPDSIAPEGNVAINRGLSTGRSANYTTSRTVLLHLSASDEESGVDGFRLGNDDANYGSWFAFQAAPTHLLTSGNGLKTVYVQYKDFAGNISAAYTATVTLDESAGTDYSLSINRGDLWTNSTAVSLTIPAQAGTAEMQISNDGGFTGASWEPYSLYKNWQITSFGNNVLPRTVYARFRNTVGNPSGTFQDDIILDITAPESEVTQLALSAARSSSPSIVVQWSGDDDLSGIKWYDVQVQINGGAWQNWLTQTTEQTADYIATAGNTYSFRTRAQDNAGNWEEYSDTTKSVFLPYDATPKLFLPSVMR